MIEFKNVSVNLKQKEGTLAAVHDVSFSIDKGEIFGIVGSSGAGKSTLLRTVNLLQRVTSGYVTVEGKDITKLRGRKLREHRRSVGMITQNYNLADNRTVYQNIALALRFAGKSRAERDETIRKYLSLAGILDEIDTYPGKLSGGQKQRVAIARALAGDAKILLCDEPTLELDVEATVSILNLIRELNHQLGITVVIITHELEVIKSICSRCAVMDGGKLVELGNVYELFTKPKHSYTKQLISHTQRFDLPPEVIKNTEGKIVKLTFLGPRANRPIISDITVRFGISFNILVGRVEYIEEKPIGMLYVNPVGDEERIRQALAFLEDAVTEVEVIRDDKI